ncbi:MAG: hypothetical protein AABW79_01775 [Nanoarchaeota archaeon]
MIQRDLWYKPDIFIASDIDSQQIMNERSPILDRIGDFAEGLGKKVVVAPLVAHRLKDDAAFTYYILEAVGGCDLFIADIGHNSTSVGMILGRAYLSRKNVILSHERKNVLESVRGVRSKVIGTSMDREQNSEVLNSPHAFLFHDELNAELKAYPHIFGVVRFDNYDECFRNVSAKIREYFSS